MKKSTRKNKKKREPLLTIDDITVNLALDYSLPPIEYFVGLQKGRECGFYEGLDEGARQSYDMGWDLAESFLGAMKYQPGKPSKKLTKAKNVKTKYEKGLSRGYLIRDLNTGLPIEVVPTQEDLFRPRQRYFKAKEPYKKWDLTSARLGRALDTGAYDDLFEPNPDVGGEVLGQTKSGRKISVARLSDIPVETVVDDMMSKNPFRRVKIQDPLSRPMLTLHKESPKEPHIEEVDDEINYTLGDTFMSPFVEEPETPIKTKGKTEGSGRKSRTQRRKEQRRRSKKGRVAPKKLMFGEVDPEEVERGKEKEIEEMRDELDNLLNTSDEVPELSVGEEAYNYAMGLVGHAPLQQTSSSYYDPEAVKEMVRVFTSGKK